MPENPFQYSVQTSLLQEDAIAWAYVQDVLTKVRSITFDDCTVPQTAFGGAIVIGSGDDVYDAGLQTFISQVGQGIGVLSELVEKLHMTSEKFDFAGDLASQTIASAGK